MELPYPEAYFALQFTFARRMVALTGQPLAQALLDLTAFYKILGCPGDFDAGEPVWRALLAGVEAAATDEDAARRAHGYYLSRLDQIPRFSHERHWGCFGFEWRPEQAAARIHFSNQDAPEPGALSHLRVAARREELRTMFAAAREELPAAQWVIGGSWLYNLEAYRRLFPPAYAASATPTEPETQFRSLWGQFLRSDGALNKERAATLLARVSALSDPAHYAACFPYQVMQTRAPIADFYAFYGV